jgi:hypothetical protein
MSELRQGELQKRQKPRTGAGEGTVWEMPEGDIEQTLEGDEGASHRIESAKALGWVVPACFGDQ